MAPFRLELPDYVPLIKEVNKRVFYSKNEYGIKVKVADWNYSLDSLPYDVNPICPGSRNDFLSHYHNFGFAENDWTTTTGSMLEQIKLKDNPEYNIPGRKYMVNYFVYNDTLPCQKSKEQRFCPEICADDYLTTMQDSYESPHLMAIKGVSIEKPPFLKYRKLKQPIPALSDNKFYDEDFKDHATNLQKNKMQQFHSFNPMTGIMTDGTKLEDDKITCYILDYDTRETPTKCYANLIESQDLVICDAPITNCVSEDNK